MRIDRSSIVFYYISKKDKEDFFISKMFQISFIKLSLVLHILDDLANELTKQRDKLYSLSPRSNYRIYKKYKEMNVNYQKYRMIFTNLSNYCSDDEYLNEYFDRLLEDYAQYNKQYEKLHKEYSTRIMINNAVVTFWFSLLSIIIALAALVTIIIQNQSSRM